MTPPAATAAGRRNSASAPSRPARTTRPAPAPRILRRVSGPVRGRMPAPAPRAMPAAPRDRLRSLPSLVAHRVRALPDHTLVDRLVRGRSWIPVLGVLLAGIVAMQVEVLKLGTSMGKWIERTSALQVRNESLRASVAALADDQRIERLAAGMGMVMPAPTSLDFLAVHPGQDVAAATAHIHSPDPTGFIASLPLAATQNPTTTGVAPPGGVATATSTQSTATTTTSTSAAPATTSSSTSGTQSAASAASTGGAGSGTAGTGSVTPAPSSSQGSGGASPSTGGASPSGGG